MEKNSKIELNDIQINNFRISNEILKECDIKNINMEKYQSKIKKISKLYLYIKELSKSLNKYESSNADHFFKSILKVIKESNAFYTNDLQKSEIQYFIKLNQKLSKILETISEKSSLINPEDFTEEKKKKRLKDIMNERTKTSRRIQDIMHNMKQIIKSKIGNMREHKDKKRDDFNEIATKIAEENNNVLEGNKEKINDINTEFKNFCEAYVQSIKDLTKHKQYESSNSLSLENNDDSSLTTTIQQENNFAYNVLIESDMNIIFKIAASPVALIGGIFDRFRDHSEEYEKFIKDYENSVNDSLSIYEEKTDATLKQIEKFYCEQIKDIFSVNGKDLKKIKDNETLFKTVDKEFENLLSSLAEA